MSDSTRGLGSFEVEEQKFNWNTNHVLAIAINDYRYQSDLKNPIDDCDKLLKLLCSKYRFEEKNITKLYNTEATRSNILDQFESYRKLTSKDNLIILFSGHGYYDKPGDEGYWIPVDAKKRRDYISTSTIKTELKAFKALHVAMIIDSCFSGVLTRKANPIDQLAKDYPAAYKAYQKKSRWAMTSGRVELVYDGNEGDNSPFARSVIQQLKDNNKGMLLFSELGVSVRNLTNRNADQDPSCSFLRHVGDELGEFSFILKDFDAKFDIALETSTSAHSSESTRVNDAPAPKEKEAPQVLPLPKLKRKVQEHIIRDEILEALELLVFNLNEDSLYKSIALSRLSEHHRLQNNVAMGAIRNITVENSSFIMALNTILGALDESDLV